MARRGGYVEVKFNKIGHLRASIKERSRKTVLWTAKAIVQGARAGLVPGHGVQTGALRASIYAVTPSGSDYGGAVSAASALNPEAEMSAEVRPLDKDSAAISAAAAYAPYVHDGHATSSGSFVPGIPFLKEAAEAARPGFEEGMKGVAKL